MKQAKVLTQKEQRRVLAVIDAGNHAARNKCAFYLTHLAGLRVKEVAALRVADIYDSAGKVHGEIRLSPDQTKGNSTRSIVLNRKLQKVLAEYYGNLPKQDSDFSLIYSQKSYKSFSPNSLCQVFSRIYVAAGIRGATSHSGRRTFITKLASKGIGVRVIMELAGHKHLSTTQRYIEVNDQMLKEAVELV
jgi:integrase/recombinase XerD